MITLHVDEFCHTCPEFDPVVKRIYAENKLFMQRVVCSNCSHCRNIYDNISSHILKKESGC